MHYAEGKPGRVFLIRIDHGEDVLETLHRFIREKDIRAGTIQLLGALGQGRMVTGPEEPVLPPVPHFEEVDGGWEVLGIAGISWDRDTPHVHLHAVAGRGKKAMAGCMREIAEAYIVVEAVIFEIAGIDAIRLHDRATGLVLPHFSSREEK